MSQIVSVVLALVASHDVEEVVLGQKAIRHIRPEQVGVAAWAKIVAGPGLEGNKKQSVDINKVTDNYYFFNSWSRSVYLSSL